MVIKFITDDSRVTWKNKNEFRAKWAIWKNLDEEERKKINLASIPPNDIPFDLEDKNNEERILTEKDCDKFLKKIEEDNINDYIAVKNGSRGFHIHTEYPELLKYDQDTRTEIRKLIFEKYFNIVPNVNVCPSKSSENTLISVIGKPHHKTGKIATIYREKHEGINQLLQEIIDNAKGNIENSRNFKLNTLTDEEFKNYFEKDPFFLWIKENIEKLPMSCEFNNVVASNIAVACKKSGKTPVEIEKIIKPLLKRIKGYSFNEFKGWLKGDADNYSKGAIENWRKQYISDLKKESFYPHDFIEFDDTGNIIAKTKNSWYDSWGKVKSTLIKNFNEKEEIKEETGEKWKLYFAYHSRDEIIGKPQLVYETMQKIPLVMKIITYDKKGNKFTSYKFLDDNYDARSGGYIEEQVKIDFWIYRIVHEGHEYFIFSKKKLEDKPYTFKGMKIEMKNTSEFTKTLKLRSLATVFYCSSFEGHIKTLNPKELVEFTKEMKKKYNWDEKGFQDFIFTHPNGNIYDFTEESNKIRTIQLLSGKYEEYPLHMMLMGPVGTGKTTALECLDWKFKEEKGILEAGNSTPKSLIPSFKEKPANPGYILNCIRVGLVDELMKMVTNLNNQTRYLELTNQYLSQLNPLLEHKRRTFSSGNDNSITTSATCKVIIATNPLPDKSTIAEHVGFIDATTLSRMLIWCQNSEEVKKIRRKEIRKNNIIEEYNNIKNKNNSLLNLYVIISNFLTIYDSCQEFLCKMDEKQVKSIIDKVSHTLKEPMKSVWLSRSHHHSTLILDGIVKIRCLFQDFSENFEADSEDYKELERILTKMIENWNENFIILAIHPNLNTDDNGNVINPNSNLGDF